MNNITLDEIEAECEKQTAMLDEMIEKMRSLNAYLDSLEEKGEENNE